EKGILLYPFAAEFDDRPEPRRSPNSELPVVEDDRGTDERTVAADFDRVTAPSRFHGALQGRELLRSLLVAGQDPEGLWSGRLPIRFSRVPRLRPAVVRYRAVCAEEATDHESGKS